MVEALQMKTNYFDKEDAWKSFVYLHCTIWMVTMWMENPNEMKDDEALSLDINPMLLV